MSWLSNSLHQLNRINPVKSKQNYKLFKSALAILIVLSLIFKVSQNLAQEASLADDVNQAADNVSMEAWNFRSMETTSVQFCNSLFGICPTENSILENISQNNGNYIPGGLVGTTNNLVAQTFKQPVSGVLYLAQLKDGLLGKPAYAQGVGFQGLQPLLPIWKSFRNVVYLLSSIFFIVLGMMIMFRLKINPQTILTVQNAIPKVITTLLLVTFSYAIAGLLIDLSYLIQGVGLSVLFASQGKLLSQNLISGDWLFGIPANIFKQYTFKGLSNAGLGDMFNLIWNAFPGSIISILGLIIGSFIGGLAGAGTGPGIIGTIAAGGGIGIVIAQAIIGIIVIICILKFFFAILKVYVNIILKIILAPFEIGLGSIPGMKIGFNSWITDLFANIMVFPITFLFLVLANIIIEKTGGTSGLWAPNMFKYNLPGTAANLLAGVGGGLVPVALGFAVISILPKLPELIPQVIFAIKPSPWQSGSKGFFDSKLGQAVGQSAVG
ncbi:MAG: hypothetical protein ABID04_03755, partial [Patescibacteria group bacterium]